MNKCDACGEPASDFTTVTETDTGATAAVCPDCSVILRTAALLKERIKAALAERGKGKLN